MKSYLLQALKEIALLGGVKNKVEISSIELSRLIDSSQQSASRYLLELDKQGLIFREFGIKKQLIQVTKNGVKKLESEYMDYQQVFTLSEKLVFKGVVVSGLGEGRYYTVQNGYVDQFQKRLGFRPFPGTLNVEIKYVEKNKLRILKNYNAIFIDEFRTDDRTFGGVKCYYAEINGAEGAIVLPLRSHYSNVLEFISGFNLRERLGLKDGDEVKIVIFVDEKNID